MPSRCSAISRPAERGRDERGLTLIEVSVVIVLASLVMLALLGFYLHSQVTWTDASSQAITQRELTGVLERLTDKVHRAASAQVVDNPDPLHQHVELYDTRNNSLYRLEWRPDGLLYESGPDIPGGWHPILGSQVSVFQLAADSSTVTLLRLTLRTATGDTLGMSSRIALMNGKRR